jgi:hypothetical protein
MSWELYESVTETLDIMSDSEMLVAFRQGVRNLQQGNTYPWEQVRKELGLPA